MQYLINSQLTFSKQNNIKIFPGGTFSIIVIVFNISVLAGCLVFYFFQSNQISVHFQFSQFNPDILSFITKETTINISLSQYGNQMKNNYKLNLFTHITKWLYIEETTMT